MRKARRSGLFNLLHGLDYFDWSGRARASDDRVLRRVFRADVRLAPESGQLAEHLAYTSAKQPTSHETGVVRHHHVGHEADDRSGNNEMTYARQG